MRTLFLSASAAVLALLAGCAGNRNAVAVTEEGCVTAAGGQLILTDLDPGAPAAGLQHRPPEEETSGPTPEAYVLAGNTDHLGSLVGRRVRITGAADARQVAEVRQIAPMVKAGDDTPVATSLREGGASGPVEHRLEVHRLRVTSANSTGERCEPAMP